MSVGTLACRKLDAHVKGHVIGHFAGKDGMLSFCLFSPYFTESLEDRVLWKLASFGLDQ